MLEQMVIQQRVLVQVTSRGLAAVKVMVLPDGAILYNPSDRVEIVPICPMNEIMPLDQHVDKVTTIIFSALALKLSTQRKGED